MGLVSVELLALKNTTASGLYGLSDVLSSMGIVWETLVSDELPSPKFDVRIIAEDAEPFRLITGGYVAPDASVAASTNTDVVIVPGISIPARERAHDADERISEWLRLRKEQGALITSACTGAFVLAEAGLLEGQEATTHWAYRDTFRMHFPGVRLLPERNLCFATNGIITSGGTTAWQLLASFLISRFWGAQQAVQAAKFWLLPDIGELQGPYFAMPINREHNDSSIRACQSWIFDNYATQNPVDAMIDRSKLPPTTFSRRFRRATGYAPMEYVHALRVENAKRFLEVTDHSIERIGRRVGYEDTASFRRLFKREAGLAPRDYRRLFDRARFEAEPLPSSDAKRIRKQQILSESRISPE